MILKMAKIINGVSDIIAKIFDKSGEHTRAAGVWIVYL